MASDATFAGVEDSAPPGGAALQHGHWRRRNPLSSGVETLERFLGAAGFDRAPWLAVAFAAGIAAWFDLANPRQWLALVALCLGMGLLGAAVMRPKGRLPFVRLSLILLPGAVALGCLTVWAKSEIVGARPISRPLVVELTGEVLAREDRPAEDRVRLMLATREPGTARPIVVRVNVPIAAARAEVVEGATISLRARLMPPSPPMLAGATILRGPPGSRVFRQPDRHSESSRSSPPASRACASRYYSAGCRNMFKRGSAAHRAE